MTSLLFGAGPGHEPKRFYWFSPVTIALLAETFNPTRTETTLSVRSAKYYIPITDETLIW
jgi:hypothetical protein